MNIGTYLRRRIVCPPKAIDPMRVPVEGLPAPHHDGLRRLAPLEPVLAGELGGVLGRLGPAGDEPHPVEVTGGELGHGLGQGLEGLAREEVQGTNATLRACAAIASAISWTPWPIEVTAEEPPEPSM